MVDADGNVVPGARIVASRPDLVPGATVELVAADSAAGWNEEEFRLPSALTDERGVYRLPVSTAIARPRLIARASGHVTVDAMVHPFSPSYPGTVVNPSRTTQDDLLLPQRDTAIAVVVRDEAGEPVSGAQVWCALSPEPVRSDAPPDAAGPTPADAAQRTRRAGRRSGPFGETDANGEVTFNLLPEVTYEIRAATAVLHILDEAGVWVPSWRRSAVVYGGPRIPLRGPDPITVDLPAGRYTALVVTADGREWREGFEISAGGRTSVRYR